MKKTTMSCSAATLHNIPEMHGAALPSISENEDHAGGADIAIQNFPEGAIIPAPRVRAGNKRAFFYGMASGIVEPIAAVVTILLTGVIAPPPFGVCGGGIYVVVEEPRAHLKHQHDRLCADFCLHVAPGGAQVAVHHKK